MEKAIAKIYAVVAAVVIIIALVAGGMYYYLSIPGQVVEKTPIRIGFSQPLTGSLGAGGQATLLSLKIWAEDVNAKGGLLGRPIELVYYDDHSNPADTAAIYEKLIGVDKVDLILGPYATIPTVAALPIAMKYNRTLISVFATYANEAYHYPYYFSVMFAGPKLTDWSIGFCEIVNSVLQRPTVAVVAIANEVGDKISRGFKENCKNYGFNIIYETSYPPTTADFTSVLLPVKAANPDVVFFVSYPTDSVGLIKAAKEIDLRPKIIGGSMTGLQYAFNQLTLGKTLNGVIIHHSWIPAPALMFNGTAEFISKYQALAPTYGVDPLGYYLAPWSYSAGQVLQQAVEATGSLDQKIIGEYIRTHKFQTIVGELEFDPASGELKESKLLYIQFQGLTRGDLLDFTGPTHLKVLYPPKYKSGDLIFPFPGWD